MALPRLRTIPGLLLALTVLAELAAALLSWGLEPRWDTLLYVVFSCAMATVGALIVSRHPRHRIGWLMLCIGVENAIAADLAQGWGLRAAADGWPAGPAAEAVATASWLPQAPAVVLIVLLFPTDRLLGRRSRGVVWLSLVAAAVGTAAWVLGPDARSEYVAGVNPYEVTVLPMRAVFVVAFATTGATLAMAFATSALRLRRSSGVERLQLKWFALATGFLVVTLPVAGALWDVMAMAHLLIAVALTAWPVSIGVAILRYRLYDIDLIVSRTFSYATLTVMLAAVYSLAVVALGAVAGRDSAWVTAAATLLAAVVFRLLHLRVQEQVDRRFRPAHREAQDLVRAFEERLRDDRAEPEEVVEVLRAAVQHPDLQLRFVLQSDEPPVDERGRPAAAVPEGSEKLVVERGGLTLAQIV